MREDVAFSMIQRGDVGRVKQDEERGCFEGGGRRRRMGCVVWEGGAMLPVGEECEARVEEGLDEDWLGDGEGGVGGGELDWGWVGGGGGGGGEDVDF